MMCALHLPPYARIATQPAQQQLTDFDVTGGSRGQLGIHTTSLFTAPTATTAPPTSWLTSAAAAHGGSRCSGWTRGDSWRGRHARTVVEVQAMRRSQTVRGMELRPSPCRHDPAEYRTCVAPCGTQVQARRRRAVRHAPRTAAASPAIHGELHAAHPGSYTAGLQGAQRTPTNRRV